MRRAFFVLTVAALAAVDAPFAAQSADPLAAAVEALGVSGTRTLRFTALGAAHAVGQSPSPGEGWPRVTVKSYEATIDFEAPAMRVELAREMGPVPPRGGGVPFTGEQRVTQFVSGAEAWDVPAPPRTPGPPGAALPATPPPAPMPQPRPEALAERTAQIWLTPHGFLRAAMAGPAARRASGGGTEVTVTVGGRRFVGTIDARHRVSRVQTWLDNPVLGDMPLEVVYRDYEKSADGVEFPTHVIQRQGGRISLELWVTTAQANVPAAVAVPADVRGARPPAVQVMSETIAPGVHYLTGGSHHSVAIEMRDHVIVVEAPQNDARSQAVIARVKELAPGRPIRYVVNTHHHFDHSGGLRTYVDEGSVVVTSDRNRAFYEEAWAAPRTIAPDRLAASGRRPAFQTFTDRHVFTDGSRTVEVHRIAASPHAEGFAMVYLPAEQLLIEADAFTPAAAPATAAAPAAPGPAASLVSPTTLNLYDNVRRLKLNVARIAALHGPRVAAFEELARAAGRAGGN